MTGNTDNLTKAELQLLERFQEQEITGTILYNKLSRREKDKNNSKLLKKMAEDELKHYNLYKQLTGKTIKPNRWQIFVYNFFAFVLGPTFVLKLMEKNEENDQVLYSKLEHVPNVRSIIEDEEKHEQELIGMIREDRINYMGSVVLGLNDALVELTGALAGLTFALQNPGLIALTGSITGIAAAFSMAASEYLSTKSEGSEKHAVKASIYTGMAYILTVVILILPYLLFKNVFISLGLTLAAAVIIIAAFNYYYSVVKEEKFIRRFGEMVILSIGVALLSFGVGMLLRGFFGIEI
ncbi:MAG: VIT1/CCC1 transporter family protein [Bacteroidales bacterium]|nr:VIT1/CCC1 transporter family protein [Bacteroidales bacterium]